MRKSDAIGIASGIIHDKVYPGRDEPEVWVGCHNIAVEIVTAIMDRLTSERAPENGSREGQ